MMRRLKKKTLSGCLALALILCMLNVTTAFSSSDYEEPQETEQTVETGNSESQTEQQVPADQQENSPTQETESHALITDGQDVQQEQTDQTDTSQDITDHADADTRDGSMQDIDPEEGDTTEDPEKEDAEDTKEEDPETGNQEVDQEVDQEVGPEEEDLEEEDIEEAATRLLAAAYRSATFTATLTNASAIIYHYTVNRRNQIQGLENSGEMSANDRWTMTYDASVANYWVVFAKVPENYLLTGVGASGAGDIYPINASDYGNIEKYPQIHALANQYGKDNGYNVIFGYSRGANATLDSATFELLGQSPTISVSVTANKVANLVPGTVVDLKLTVTPGKLEGKSVDEDKVLITGLYVNDQQILIDGQSTYELTKDSNGQYTITVPYTLTDADCIDPTVTVKVDGSVDYSYTLGVSNNGKITTTSTVSSSDQTTIQIENYKKVTYSYVFDKTPEYDRLTFPGLPTDTNRYYLNQPNTVNVDRTVPGSGEVIDDQNHGKWKFDGWYLNGEKQGETYQLPDGSDEDLEFIGYWHFEKNKIDVTVTKMVAGNMGDRTHAFHFQVTDASGSLKEFDLIHEKSEKLTNLEVDSEIILAESDNVGYTVEVTYGGTPVQVENGVYKITLEDGKTDIVVTNTKEAIPPTGITDNTRPEQMLLLMAVLLLVLRVSGTVISGKIR